MEKDRRSSRSATPKLSAKVALPSTAQPPDTQAWLNLINALHTHPDSPTATTVQTQIWTPIGTHLMKQVPLIFGHDTEQPWNLMMDEERLTSCILAPLLRVLCNDVDVDDMKSFANRLGFGDGFHKEGQICGHAFKSGEPTYSCTYRMHTSSGFGGYCDCGDVEAWTKGTACCERHLPSAEGEQSTSEPLDAHLSKHMMLMVRIFLSYACDTVLWAEHDTLPPVLAHLDTATGSLRHTITQYHTVLLNDESHTFDAVIKALERAIACTRQQATLLATIVDREGRCSIRCGSNSWCSKAKEEILKSTAKSNNLRTEKSGPLNVNVVDAVLIAHQQCATRVLMWLAEAARQFPPLQSIIARVLMEPAPIVDIDSSVTSDSMLSIAERSIENDNILYKSARLAVHNVIMASCLADMAAKSEFAVLFTRHYPALLRHFVDDDCEHSASVMGITVQIYTVTTISRRVIGECNALSRMFELLSSFTEQYENPTTHILQFRQPNQYPARLRRALVVADDVKYLLTTPPTPDEWTDELQLAFLDGCDALVKFIGCIDGMDAVKRVTGEHQQWESEWETALNMQIRLDDIYQAMTTWAASDATVLQNFTLMCLKAVAAHWQQTYGEQEVGNQMESIACLSHECRALRYDVSEKWVSIHQPTCRLLAALMHRMAISTHSPSGAVHELADFDMSTLLSYVTNHITSVSTEDAPVLLMELLLRVTVLSAQTQSGMWRRNGYSLLNQIHNYTTPQCRIEMYDRDILMLQNSCALMTAEQFLLRVWHKFNLLPFMQFDYESSRPPLADGGDLSKHTVCMAEEMLHAVIMVVVERYNGVGVATKEQYIQRELVHLLCAGPLPFSKLAKRLMNELRGSKIVTENMVNAVADFRQPSLTSAGTFVLKESLLPAFSPFFWHFTKQQMSEAEQAQRTLRKSSSLAVRAFAPSAELVPALHDAYTNILRLLDSELTVHMCLLNLRRFERRSRFSSDATAHRVLYLMGVALNEELSPSTPNTDAVQFTATCDEYLKKHGAAIGLVVREEEGDITKTVPALLQRLCQSPDCAAVADLCTWVAQQYVRCTNVRRTALNPAAQSGESTVGHAAEVDAPTGGQLEADETANRERRKKIAAEKRRAAQEQMRKMQQNIMEKNKHLFGAEADGDGVDDDDCNAHEGELVTPSTFPICCGVDKTAVHPAARSRRVTCVLCMETETIKWTNSKDCRPMALAGFVQWSSLYTSDASLPSRRSVDLVIMPSSTAHATHVSTCGHAMHFDCAQQLRKSVVEKEQRRLRHNPFINRRILNAEKGGEFLCALCKRLSNALLPLLPPDLPPSTHDRHSPIDEETDTSTSIASVASSSDEEIVDDDEQEADDIVTDAPLAPDDAMSVDSDSSDETLVSPLRSLVGGGRYDDVTTTFADWVNDMSAAVNTAASGLLHPPNLPTTYNGSRKSKGRRDRRLSETDKSSPSSARKRTYSTTNEDTTSTTVELDDAVRQLRMAAALQTTKQQRQESPSKAGLLRHFMPHNMVSRFARIFGHLEDATARGAKGGKGNRHYPLAYWPVIDAYANVLLKRYPTAARRTRPTPSLASSSTVASRTRQSTKLASTSSIALPDSLPDSDDVQDALGSESRSYVLGAQSCAYTLRCVVAELTADSKPLFGAWSTRQAETIYSLSLTSVAMTHCARHIARGAVAVALLTPLLQPSIARCHIIDIDMHATLIQLLLSVRWLYAVDATAVTTHSYSVPDGCPLDQYIVRLVCQAHLYQMLVAGVQEGEHEREEGGRLATLVDRIYGDGLQPYWPGSEAATSSAKPPRRTTLTERVTYGLRSLLQTAALFMHAVTRVPAPEALKDPSIDQLPLLCRYVGLPQDMDELVNHLYDGHEAMFAAWHTALGERQSVQHDRLTAPQPRRPNMLIDLPRDYSTLITMAANFACPLLRSDDSTRAPTLCLVCGQLLCSQSYCCQRMINRREQRQLRIGVEDGPEDEEDIDLVDGDDKNTMAVGACNYHMHNCSGMDAAVYLRLRDAQVIMLTSHARGCFMPAPYVDQFGETDQGFNRGKALHLNESLYGRLKSMWLRHSVGEHVIGQYEINPQNLMYDWSHY